MQDMIRYEWTNNQAWLSMIEFAGKCVCVIGFHPFLFIIIFLRNTRAVPLKRTNLSFVKDIAFIYEFMPPKRSQPLRERIRKVDTPRGGDFWKRMG
jgi:hypothetical protein